MLVINIAAKCDISVLYSTNKIERFSFKTGCVIWVTERLKEEWLIVLQ